MESNTRQVGLALPRGDERFPRLARAVAPNGEANHPVTLLNLGYDDFDHLGTVLASSTVDGLLICASPSAAGQHLSMMVAAPKTVGLFHPMNSCGLPSVAVDVEAGLAALLEHLTAASVAQWAYLGQRDNEASQSAAESLQRSLEARGQPLSVRQESTARMFERDDPADDAPLAEWLAGLDKPAAVVCFSPAQAVRVANLCRRMDEALADELYLAALHDDPACLMVEPPITAVSYPVERVGEVAMQRVIDGLNGDREALRPTAHVVPGAELYIRRSTGRADPDQHAVDRAVRLIRDHACTLGSVEELMNQTQLMSRSKFFKRFRDRTGVSPYVMIRRVRMDRARRLLTETDLSVSRIATKCGYGEARHFTTTFRRTVGVTPSAFRKARRAGEEMDNRGV